MAYKLIRGKPIEEIEFTCLKPKSGGKYRNKMLCDDIFTIDTETTSDYIDENGKPFMFDYDNPDKAQNAVKHSVCYLWQFGINEDTRYIGRSLYDLCDLLFLLDKYCPHYKIVFCHNLAFDFNFFINVIKFTRVFARKPRHPMTIYAPAYHIEMRCSYVLTNLKLESWALALNLPVKKHTGQLKYDQMRTPLTPLTAEEIDYSIADLDVMYYGLKVYKEQYGHVWLIPLTHTGKMRHACSKIMESEINYCQKVTKLMPQSLDEYVEQAHAFIGGSVFCNWLYKNRVIKEDKKRKIRLPAYDIASSYPWVLIAALYPSTPFQKTKPKYITKYMHNPKYVYLVKFKIENMESLTNCHFMSRSKALSLSGCQSDNGRIVRAKSAEFILTSVDFELFIKLYDGTIKIEWLKYSYAKPLNNKFRKFIIDLYKDKTTLKGVEGMETIYQNKKESINSGYGDFVTKIFADAVVFNQNQEIEWTIEELTDETFLKALAKVNKKWAKNYKAFCQGIFVTAWARKRIWDAVLKLDENIMYSDTDSLKLFNYNGDYFEKDNAEIMKRHAEIAKELKIDIEDLSPVDIKGKPHPIGVWELEAHYKEFKSLGCKQYIYKDQENNLHLTCAGVSKLAVKCFKNCADFKTDRRLTEKELKECTDGNGHTAEKLTPYYSNDYPVVTYPDGYVCKYKHGVCLMPTTFNLQITPQDLLLLYNEVRGRLNKSYFTKGV